MYSVERKLQYCIWALAGLALTGCNHADTARTCWRGEPAPASRAPNLALAPNAVVNRIAVGLDRGSNWPSCDLGYRFDDVSSYAEVLFDNQIAYDRYGSVFRSGQSFRSGVLVR